MNLGLHCEINTWLAYPSCDASNLPLILLNYRDISRTSNICIYNVTLF